MRRVGFAVITLLGFVLAGSAEFLGAQGSGDGQEPGRQSEGGPDYRGGATYLNQGWDYDTTQWWYHVSQGTVFMPYEWFLALEQPVGQELFSAPGHLQRLGFLLNPPNAEDNPNGLPVGFSKQPLKLDAKPYSCWQGDWVGFSCAACHTGQVSYHGQQIRVEGGPAHHDIETFQDELTAALAATAASRPKFARFAGRVLASGAATNPQELAGHFQCFVGALGDRRSFFEAAQAQASEEPTASGFGRLDAIHRGGNLLLAAPLGEEKNYVPTTAPVSFPALWDTPYFDWVLYNASLRQPLARNVIEALGVGAPLDPSTIFRADRVVHGVQMDAVVEIQRDLMDLESPRWPEDILGPIDRVRAERGEELYNQLCAGCHQVIDPATHAPVEGEGAKGPGSDEIVIPTLGVDEVGTDPRQAVNFAGRTVALGKIGGPVEIPYKDAAQVLTGKIVDQWVAASPANAEKAEAINRGRANEFRGPLKYRARPLNGIWATAPYLHNGSVPSLHQLLLPAEQRARIFYMGSWEFDPEHVGFEWGSPFPGAFTFDTRLPGNSNAGHEYGTGLNAQDRMALIEFLKTL